MQVLIAEDEREAAELYRMVLETRGHVVTLTFNGKDCVDVYRKALEHAADKPSFDVVVLDYRMPLMDGLQAAKEILEVEPKQRIIFASAHAQVASIDVHDKFNQVVQTIQKPFDPDHLADIIEFV
jgi:two-component system cell cycle response regulator CpdR